MARRNERHTHRQINRQAYRQKKKNKHKRSETNNQTEGKKKKKIVRSHTVDLTNRKILSKKRKAVSTRIYETERNDGKKSS